MKLKVNIKAAIYFMALGASLVAYAHNQFATKNEVKSNTHYLERIDDRTIEILKLIK